MRLKSELYAKEQEELSSKIISILDLDIDNSTTLYELDNNKEKQQEIMKLIPDIRKYVSYACIKGVREPEKVNRPYLSIIKHLTKPYYHFYNSDTSIVVNDKKVRTKRYILIKRKSNLLITKST